MSDLIPETDWDDPADVLAALEAMTIITEAQATGGAAAVDYANDAIQFLVDRYETWDIVDNSLDELAELDVYTTTLENAAAWAAGARAVLKAEGII